MFSSVLMSNFHLFTTVVLCPPTGMIFNEADQELRDTGYHRHAFNVLISTRLGYHRELPDTRDPQ